MGQPVETMRSLIRQEMRKRLLGAARRVCVVACFAAASQMAAQAQILRTLSGTTVQVHVQETNGTPIAVQAEVEITKAGGEAPMLGETGAEGTATVRGVPSGDYTVNVTAPGYDAGRERLYVAQSAISANVYVTLKRSAESAESAVAAQPAQLPILTGKSKKELDQAISDLRDGKVANAGKHLEYPLKNATNDPSVQYVAGVYSVDLKDFAAARQHFEASIGAYPDLFNAQLGLGSLLLQQLGDAADAIPHLDRAVELDATSWRARWLLAQAYLAQGGDAAKADAAKAEAQAQRAMELGKEKGAGAAVTLAYATALTGNREQARAVLEKFIHDYPNNPLIPNARALLRSALVASAH
jgi:tetratricopeptide (TPR) repeat protein